MDVGAHVGTFAVQAAEAVGAGGRVIALEPTPKTFACLAANASGHAAFFAAGGPGGGGAATATKTSPSPAITLSASAGGAGPALAPAPAPPPTLTPAPITALNTAAGPPGRSSAVFTVYRAMAGLSTCVPVLDDAMEASLTEYVKRAPPRDWRHRLAAKAQAVLPARAFDAGARAFARSVVRPRDEVTCAMAPLSETLASPAVALDPKAEIGLLKIDVERYELEVMAGITPADWARVRQLVFECHDAGAGVAAAKAAGFKSVVVDDGGAEAAGVTGEATCNVYCRK